ncbi:centrosomal protein kizuna isoform X2 [Lissotriton helveticus]
MMEPAVFTGVRRQRRPPAGSDYYQRIGALQQNLRDSEKRRLELERKLFEYSQSNRAISHLKYVKLKNSLKEICEWEKRAHRRNQEILQDFDRIEAHIMTLTTNTDKLQQMKSEYEKCKQTMVQTFKKSKRISSDEEDKNSGQVLQAEKQAGIKASLSRGSYHPATIFMSRQMSDSSSIEHFSTEHKSPQPTKSFSIYDPNACRQAAESSSLTDRCVIQTNGDMQCLNKADKIDGKTSLQIRKKASISSSISSEHEPTHSADLESVTSNRSHSMEDEQSAKLGSQLHERLSPENRNKDLKYYNPSSKVEKVLAREKPAINEERFEPSHPELFPGAPDSFSERPSDNPEAGGGSGLGLKVVLPQEHTELLDNESLDSSSDLTVSVSDSDDDLSPMKHQMNVQHTNRMAEITSSGHTKPKDEFGPSIICPQISQPTADLETSKVCFSEEGFFHLLQSVEAMVNQSSIESLQLYQSASLSPAKLKELISLSNKRTPLKEEDLEACMTLVLHQFQMLLQSTLNGPKETLVDSRSRADEKTNRYDTPIDSPSFLDRLYKHALFLKDHNLLQEEDMAERLHSLLAVRSDGRRTETPSSPQKDLSEESEEVSSFHSHGSSGSLLSNLRDTSEIKHGEPLKQLDSKRPSKPEKQETGHTVPKTVVQSNRSLSEGENRIESISDVSNLEQSPEKQETVHPVPKTVVESNRSLSEGENRIESISDISELEQSPDLYPGALNVMDKAKKKLSSEASASSSERSPLMRSEDKKKVVTNTKSKAFWGESEDSASDIEDVLRPQIETTDGDDFDDFYD